MKCGECNNENSERGESCGICGAKVEFDPLICHACGKVYLYGDDDGLCDDPMCGGAHLEPLLGFISYRRKYISHRVPDEKNDVAVRIKDRIEKVLHSQRVTGGFFIDKSGIEREDFEKKISKTIEACSGGVFLLILTPGALDPRESEDEDWMRNEIQLAIKHGLEIIPVKASNYRHDNDFQFPSKLPEEIRSIQKKNVNLSFIGDLEEHVLNDAIIRITKEVRRALDLTTAARLKATPSAVVAELSLTSKPIQCPCCGCSNPNGAKFCQDCGKGLLISTITDDSNHSTLSQTSSESMAACCRSAFLSLAIATDVPWKTAKAVKDMELQLPMGKKGVNLSLIIGKYKTRVVYWIRLPGKSWEENLQALQPVKKSHEKNLQSATQGFELRWFDPNTTQITAYVDFYVPHGHGDSVEGWSEAHQQLLDVANRFYRALIG